MNYPIDCVSFESIGGTIKKAMRFINPADRHWSAFNPSIGVAPDGSMAMTIRSSNYILKPEIGKYEVVTGNLISNKTWFCKVDDNLEISKLFEINYHPVSYLDVSVSMVRGAEDAKLFWRDGGWKFTAVIKEPDFGIPIPRIGLFNFDGQNAQLTNIEHFNDESPDVAEKNWMTPYEKNPNFDYIYNENHIVKDGELIKTRENSDVIENLRGGSNLWDLGDGTYLALAHKTYVKWIEFYDSKSFGIKKSHVRDYVHYFARYDCNGILFEMSTPFRFIGRGVEFGAGLVVKNGDVIVSFGKDDTSSYFGKITLKAVLENLKET